MKALAALFLALHGVAHLVGFRAAFWPSPKLPSKSSLLGGLIGLSYLGSRVLGVIWLLLALGYLVTASLLLLHNPAWSSLALWVSGASLLMCALYWPEAKIGLFIDLAIVLVTLFVSRSSPEHLATTFGRELRAAELPAAPSRVETVTEETIAGLPATVQRYLRFMGAVGKPRDRSLRAHFQARFRREPGEWSSCEVLQYDARQPLSRLFFMQLTLEGVPVLVRDVYLQGHGSMRAKALDLVPIVDASGHELDVGELVTYLNDAILMAPSLLLGGETTWQGVDAHAFDVTLRDGQLSVKARVWLDERGAPQSFSTTDRFFDTADGRRVRTEWRTPIHGWQEARGRMLPTSAEAVWMLPEGPFTYADFGFDPSRIAFNVEPG